MKCWLLIPEKHKACERVKGRACYLPEFPGLLHSAPLSPESPTFALSGIKWSESVKQVDLNGDSGDGWSMSLLQGLDARRTGWLITQIRCRVKIHRGVIRCFISTHPPVALLKTLCWPCCALCGIPDLSGPSISPANACFLLHFTLSAPSINDSFWKVRSDSREGRCPDVRGAAPTPQRWRRKQAAAPPLHHSALGTGEELHLVIASSWAEMAERRGAMASFDLEQLSGPLSDNGLTRAEKLRGNLCYAARSSVACGERNPRLV